jgi:putative endonuclease
LGAGPVVTEVTDVNPRRFLLWLKSAVAGAGGAAKDLGQGGEEVAARYLKSLGFRIVAVRYRTPLGEIDLIARDGDCLVFVEVKTRRSTDAGAPFEAVGPAKQAQLTRLALAYLRQKGLLDRPARFDVVSILWGDGSDEPQITHYRNAFEPPGSGQMFS